MIESIEERSVSSYAVSGTVFSAIFAGSMHYDRYRKQALSKKEAIAATLRLSAQGGIASASAVATANAIGKRDYLGATLNVCVGLLGVYGIQKISEKFENDTEEKENDNEQQ